MTVKSTPPTNIASSDITWSFDLPDRLKLAIADAMTVFSRLDHAIIECIWLLKEADYELKRKISRTHAHENLKFVRKVVEQNMNISIPETWDALDDMRNERNLIAHGVWMMRFGGDTPGETAMPPTGLPMVLWHSMMLEKAEFVTAEPFDYWRFDRFMTRARLLLDTFLKFRSQAEDAINSEKRSRAKHFDKRQQR